MYFVKTKIAKEENHTESNIIKWVIRCLFLVVCISTTPIEASHFRYGHMTWTRVGGETVEITVTTAWRTAFIGSYYLYFGDGSRTPVYSSSQTQLFTGTDLQGESYTITQYKTQYTYSNEGPFTAYFSSCCRIASLINASNASYVVEATVDLRNGNDGSPVSSMPVILQMIQGQVNTVPVPVADPDGDSFSLRMASATESGVPGTASTASHTLSLDSNNNLIWNTSETNIGEKYAVQIVIEENLNGSVGKVALDFIIEIVGNTGNNSSPTCSGTNGLQVINAGDLFSASFTADDSDGDDLTVTALGLPSGTIMSPSSGSTVSSPASVAIDWTPQSSNIGQAYAITLIFEDPSGLQSIASFSMQVQAADTDGDGIPDDTDAFPNDSTKAFLSYSPAKDVYGTLAFEDNWPEKGDYDFNDLIIDYNFILCSNASNEVVQIQADLVVRAAGAAFQNGFGIQFPFTPAQVTSVTGTQLTDGYISVESNGVESGQSKATVIVFDNGNNVLGGAIVNTDPASTPVSPKQLIVDVNLATPIAVSLLSPPFNPFLIVNKERGREIHLPDFEATDLANTALFGTGVDDSTPSSGRTYRTTTNLPWVLNVNEKWDYPVERVDIVNAHLKFPDWVQSSGGNFQNWYQNQNGHRSTSNIYSR